MVDVRVVGEFVEQLRTHLQSLTVDGCALALGSCVRDQGKAIGAVPGVGQAKRWNVLIEAQCLRVQLWVGIAVDGYWREREGGERGFREA